MCTQCTEHLNDRSLLKYMKIEKTKNATRNFAFGVILKVYSLLLPFLMRTAMIYLLGVEYLGLNSLFTSILQVLNLAELGVGSAMVFSMYRPIAEDDDAKICALMRLYRLYYRIIGGVVLAAGVILLPFIPKLISGEIPGDMNVYVLYLLNLGATVLTYWLFAYRNSIFQAYQRTDVVSKITLVTDTIKYVLQFLVLAAFRSYYLYVIAILFTQICNNVLIATFSKRMYPQYEPKGILEKNERGVIIHRIVDLFTAKLGGTIVNSADTIVISAVLGLRILAVYQNYYYIINALMGIVAIVFSSVIAGSGNSIVSESKEKNFEDFRKITWVTYWIVGYAICGLACLYQPFMEIWVGKDLMLSDVYVPLMCLYLWELVMIQLIGVYKDAAGIWHEDRFRPLVSGLVNLILNLIMVRWIGLYGIVLSTLISVLCISLPWITKNVFTIIFPGKFKAYAKDLIWYTIVMLAVTFCTKFLCDFIPEGGTGLLLIKAVACSLLCNGLYAALYCRTKIFKITVPAIIRSLKKR